MLLVSFGLSLVNNVILFQWYVNHCNSYGQNIFCTIYYIFVHTVHLKHFYSNTVEHVMEEPAFFKVY